MNELNLINDSIDTNNDRMKIRMCSYLRSLIFEKNIYLLMNSAIYKDVAILKFKTYVLATCFTL